MSAGNAVNLVGNLTRDVELKYLASGQAVASFGLACTRKWQNRQTQEWEEKVSFFDVTAWGGLGENVSESLSKGSRVMVSGRLEQDTWQNEAGENRSKVKVIADEIGPSLRWATAEVAKAERKEGGQAPSDGGWGSSDEPF